MGLFNAHAVAQQRADRIATLLQSFADGQLGTPRRPAPAPRDAPHKDKRPAQHPP
ncbi:hypothetical protein, partial [Pseudomonas sp. AFW1]|uniref:hypothetical protein n=1 Tax=Pseudomonas sp. AFW1 TaxID=2807721 RepID=UPI001EEEECE1